MVLVGYCLARRSFDRWRRCADLDRVIHVARQLTTSLTPVEGWRRQVTIGHAGDPVRGWPGYHYRSYTIAVVH